MHGIGRFIVIFIVIVIAIAIDIVIAIVIAIFVFIAIVIAIFVIDDLRKLRKLLSFLLLLPYSAAHECSTSAEQQT